MLETCPECRIHPAVTYAEVICTYMNYHLCDCVQSGLFSQIRSHFNCSNLLVCNVLYAWHTYSEYGESPVLDE